MALNEGVLSAPHPDHFTPPSHPPPEIDPIPVVLVAGWGLRAGLGGSGISLPHRGSNVEPRSP